MKKIYLSFIIIIFILAVLFLSISLMAITNYGSTVRIVKNGLNQGNHISFNTTIQNKTLASNYMAGKDSGYESLPNSAFVKDKDLDSAMKYAFAQIESNKLKGHVYLDNLGKNVKWYSKSNELHVANWVKVWSNYEVEPEDPSFDY